MRITVIGMGYVGLTTGACLAYLGHEVTGVDSAEDKVQALRRGEAPFHEPGLAELMAEAKSRLVFTTSHEEALHGAQVIFICVGTPQLPDGNPDLQYLQAAGEQVGKNLGTKFTVVVNKSTVPIGSGNWLEALIRAAFESANGGEADGRFAMASNPEFLREGTALHDSLYPDRIVIGADRVRTYEVLYTLYRPLIDQAFPAPLFLPRPAGLGAVPIVATDLASAELIKYAANSFLAMKISFSNEIGSVAERVGADIEEVARGIGLDCRIGPRFLQAGIGWGGSCFGKDTAALIATASDYGLTMPLVSAAREVNQRQRGRVAEKLLAQLKILKGRKIGVLGLAFKPNTDDLRDAPSLDIIRKLVQHGAIVIAHDPVAMRRFAADYADLPVTLADSAEKVFERADAVVLLTEWQGYLELDWARLIGSMKTPVLVDGRNALDRTALQAAGYQYVTIP